MVSVLTVAVLVAAACGGSGEGDATQERRAGQATVEPEPGDEAATVAVAESELGPVLVDADGRVLYLFANDDSGESSCLEECAGAWPPLITVADGLVAAEGADAALLDRTERPDGMTQVTYNGHPLYYFAEDGAPGETNGQGVGGVWYVVSPTGEAVKVVTDESDSGGGRYG